MSLEEGQVVVRDLSEILVEIGYLDAGYAATGRNAECTLIVTNSKAGRHAYCVGLMSKGASDEYGLLILKDQFINVRDENEIHEVEENPDVINLMEILGLDYEKKYETKDDVETLRYGRILILADQNNAGCYFKGLIINFIHNYWPGLVKLDFIHHLAVPVVRAVKGREVYNFYSLQEFKLWKKCTAGSQNYQAKFYSSLAEFSSSEMKDHFINLEKQRVKFTYNGQDDDDSIILAFSGKMLKQRQDWIRNYLEKAKHSRGKTRIPCGESASYSDFINTDLIQVFVGDIDRTIPNVIDGLTRTERLALMACMGEGNQEEIEINDLAEAIARKSSYRDQETLVASILRLTENFVGSNNINLLELVADSYTEPNGEKNDSSVGNLRVKLSPLARVIFRLEEYIFYHDNRPVYYAPIVPMILINGAAGEGKTWKTAVPCYNPRDVIENLLGMIDGEEQKEMIPYYKKFKGSVYRHGRDDYVTFGEISIIAKDKILISGLPVGCCTANYRETVLDRMLPGENDSSGMIESYEDLSSDGNVKFIVTMSPERLNKFERDGLHDVFELNKIISVNSMYAFDDNLSIKYYPSISQIMTDFFNVKNKMYENTKDYLTGLLKAEILKLTNQIRFIGQVGKNQFDNYEAGNLDELINALKTQGYEPDPVTVWKNNKNKEDVLCESGVNTGPEDFDYLLDMSVRCFTKENETGLMKTKDEKQNKLASIESKTAVQMWKDDLKELLQALDEFDKSEEMEERSIKNNNLGMELTEPERCVTPKLHVEKKKMEIEEIYELLSVDDEETENLEVQECHVDVDVEEKQMEFGEIYELLSSDDKKTEVVSSLEVPKCDDDAEKQMKTEEIQEPSPTDDEETKSPATSSLDLEVSKCHVDVEEKQMEIEEINESLSSDNKEKEIVSSSDLEVSKCDDAEEPLTSDGEETETSIASSLDPDVLKCHDNEEKKTKTEDIQEPLLSDDEKTEAPVASSLDLEVSKCDNAEKPLLSDDKETEAPVAPSLDPEVLKCHDNEEKQKKTEDIQEPLLSDDEKTEAPVASSLDIQLQKCHVDGEEQTETEDTQEPLLSNHKETESPKVESATENSVALSSDSLKNDNLDTSESPEQTAETSLPSEEKTDQPTATSPENPEKENHVPAEKASGDDEHEDKPKMKNRVIRSILIATDNLDSSSKNKAVEEKKTVEPTESRQTRKSVRFTLPQGNSPVQLGNSKDENVVGEEETMQSDELVLTNDDNQVQKNYLNAEKITEEEKSHEKDNEPLKNKKIKEAKKLQETEKAVVEENNERSLKRKMSTELNLPEEASSSASKPPPRKRVKKAKQLVMKTINENQLNLSTLDEIVDEIKLQVLEESIVEERNIRRSRGRPRKSMDNVELVLQDQVQQNNSKEDKESPVKHQSPQKNKSKILQDEMKIQKEEKLIVEEKKSRGRGRPRRTVDNNQVQQNNSEKETKSPVLPENKCEIVGEMKPRGRGRPQRMVESVGLIFPVINDQMQQNHSKKPRRSIKSVELVKPKNNSKVQIVEEKKPRGRGRPPKAMASVELISPKKDSKVQKKNLKRKKSVEEKESVVSDEPPSKKTKRVPHVVQKKDVIQQNVSKIAKNKKKIKKQKETTIPVVEEEKEKKPRVKSRKTKDDVEKLILPKTDSQLEQKVGAKKIKPQKKMKFPVPKKIQPIRQKKRILKETKVQKKPRETKKKVQSVVPSTNDSAQLDTLGESEVIKEKEIPKDKEGPSESTKKDTKKIVHPLREGKLRNAKAVAGLVLQNYVDQLHRKLPKKDKPEEVKKSSEEEDKSETEKVNKLVQVNGMVKQKRAKKNKPEEEKKPSRGRGRPSKLKPGDELKSPAPKSNKRKAGKSIAADKS